MKVTVRDVAERAGVSAMAVSVVLNGARSRTARISEEKAERIRQVARELRYQPNRMGNIFRSGRTNQIAVVFQDFEALPIESLYRSDVINGVAAALFPHDYTMTLCPQLVRDGNPRILFEGRFDGVLWCRPDLSENAKLALQNCNVPVVMLHAPPDTVPGTSSFCIDEREAIRLVLDHLAKLGHEKVAFVTNFSGGRTAKGAAREASLRIAADLSGYPEPAFIQLDEDDSGLARHTALICCSAELAAVVLRAFERLGIDVPRFVSVIAFDSCPASASIAPSLTAITQPVEQMAFDAACHLLDLIHKADMDEPSIYPSAKIYECRLDIRESTGPAPRRAEKAL